MVKDNTQSGFDVSDPQLSTIVDNQQLVSFNEPENQLIDALIGIQGQGRSASPQQLNDVERAVQVLEGLEGVPDHLF
ncbi:probable plastid-lipid-associated protein 12, chloroplastic isoform X1 [Fagus crenata]